MQVRQVDERDAQWEIVGPEFRVVLISDDASTYSTFDLAGGTVGEALQWARGRHGSDRFAVAVKVVDSGNSLGLAWLTPPPESVDLAR